MKSDIKIKQVKLSMVGFNSIRCCLVVKICGPSHKFSDMNVQKLTIT